MELSIHALCAVPNGLILEDLQGGSLTELGLLAEPWRVSNGVGVPPPEVRKYFESEYERWGKTIRAGKIKVE